MMTGEGPDSVPMKGDSPRLGEVPDDAHRRREVALTNLEKIYFPGPG